MNANNRVRGEQWDICDRCGFTYPMSRLMKQKGLMVCTKLPCTDNLEVERRTAKIERILGAGVDQEGADMRVYDRSFFDGFDQEVL